MGLLRGLKRKIVASSVEHTGILVLGAAAAGHWVSRVLVYWGVRSLWLGRKLGENRSRSTLNKVPVSADMWISNDAVNLIRAVCEMEFKKNPF